jgi:hypothetical protein
MRLHPEVSEEEARAWLAQQVAREAPESAAEPELDAMIRSVAEAMAAISRIVLPDDLEPLFP